MEGNWPWKKDAGLWVVCVCVCVAEALPILSISGYSTPELLYALLEGLSFHSGRWTEEICLVIILLRFFVMWNNKYNPELSSADFLPNKQLQYFCIGKFSFFTSVWTVSCNVQRVFQNGLLIPRMQISIILKIILEIFRFDYCYQKKPTFRKVRPVFLGPFFEL